jgi:hypothetical protein
MKLVTESKLAFAVSFGLTANPGFAVVYVSLLETHRCVHNHSSCIFYRAHLDVNVRCVFPETHDKQLIHHVPPLDTRRTTPSQCDEVTTHGEKGHVHSALAVTLHRVSNDHIRPLYLFVVC